MEIVSMPGHLATERREREMAWTDESAANREHWNQRCKSHLAEWYDIDAFRSGSTHLDALQISEVGDVSGKRLLHLQCNAGIDTLSWARLGATVTGVDIAPDPLEVGRRLAEELGIPATFIQSDVYAVPEVINERFDIVYTSQGVLCWLSDLGKWAKVIASMLAPGGMSYIMEGHPYAVTLDEEEIRPTTREPYFHQKDGQYDEGDANYQWSFSLSDVVNSLIEAGLEIRFLNEHDRTFYQRLRYMEPVDDHWWTIPGYSLPLMFTLKAIKPA